MSSDFCGVADGVSLIGKYEANIPKIIIQENSTLPEPGIYAVFTELNDFKGYWLRTVDSFEQVTPSFETIKEGGKVLYFPHCSRQTGSIFLSAFTQKIRYFSASKFDAKHVRRQLLQQATKAGINALYQAQDLGQTTLAAVVPYTDEQGQKIAIVKAGDSLVYRLQYQTGQWSVARVQIPAFEKAYLNRYAQVDQVGIVSANFPDADITAYLTATDGILHSGDEKGNPDLAIQRILAYLQKEKVDIHELPQRLVRAVMDGEIDNNGDDVTAAIWVATQQ